MSSTCELASRLCFWPSLFIWVPEDCTMSNTHDISDALDCKNFWDNIANKHSLICFYVPFSWLPCCHFIRVFQWCCDSISDRVTTQLHFIFLTLIYWRSRCSSFSTFAYSTFTFLPLPQGDPVLSHKIRIYGLASLLNILLFPSHSAELTTCSLNITEYHFKIWMSMVTVCSHLSSVGMNPSRSVW